MGTGEFNAGVTLRWTSIPSRGEYKYSQSLNATETGISSGLMGHLGPNADITFPRSDPTIFSFYFNVLFIICCKVLLQFSRILSTHNCSRRRLPFSCRKRGSHNYENAPTGMHTLHLPSYKVNWITTKRSIVTNPKKESVT